MKKRIVTIGILITSAVVVVMLVLNACHRRIQNFTFETAKVIRGSVSNTVTATGTIQAIKTVAVGTQVSGVISKIYADFNSHVKKGELLAELDKTQLVANLENAQASLDDARAEMTYQTSNFERIKALYEKKLVAQTDYDLALYNYSKAEASLKIAKSGYDKAKINLDYASIYSPIDGVVLNRAVDEGQTVAASFSTPTLFSIANDLTQMQVAANIDEADIGQVKKDQWVEFSVDAFPDKKFNGKVTEIRLQSVTTSNVVTYTVIVQAPNPGQILMPGMTANIVVFVEKQDNVLTIPSKALRFKLDEETLSAYLKTIPENERPGMPKEMNANTPVDKSKGKQDPEIWVKNGKMIHQVKVEVGINDDKNAEIISGLTEGEEVVTAINTGDKAVVPKEAATTSPFMPKRPARK